MISRLLNLNFVERFAGDRFGRRRPLAPVHLGDLAFKARQIADEVAHDLREPHRAPEFSFKTYAGKTIARGQQLIESAERNKIYIRTTYLLACPT